jgi:P4 family phage/plasmid primase-like protien
MGVAGIWKAASKASPCPICGKPDWCQRTEDGVVTLCRRGEGTPGGLSRVDKIGVPYWLFGLQTAAAGRTAAGESSTAEAPEPDPIKHTRERAEPGVLDTVYRALFERCSLTLPHETDLKKRGFIRPEIDRLGYKSKPDRETWKTINTQLRASFARLILGVPGFSLHEYTTDKGETAYRFRLDGPNSILLPLRDRYGRIVGIQLDVDSGTPKYLPLTSYSPLGSKAALVCHVPLHENGTSKRWSIRLVGGVYKADIATAWDGILTISSPNEYAYTACLDDVTAFGPEIVYIAPDADVRSNPQVASGLAAAAVLYQTHGYALAIEVWPPECGKGIDDVIAAGHGDEIVIRTGASAWEFVRDVLQSSKATPNPGVEVRLVLAQLDTRLDEPSLFRAPVIHAVASLDTSTAEYQALRKRISAALTKGQVKAFDSALAKEREKLKDTEKRKRLEALEQQGKHIFRLGDEVELRDAVLDDLCPVGGTRFDHGLVVYTRDALYKYDREFGIWRELSDAVVVNAVTKYTGSPVGDLDGKALAITASKANGVVALVKAAREDKTFFDAAVSGVAFRNGFLVIDLKTGTRSLRSHARAHRARVAYPFDYVEGLKPIRYLAVLTRLCKGKPDDETAATIACLTEHLGACIAGCATVFEKAIVMLGKGGTGNSTVVNVHMAAMPAGSVCSVMPHQMEETFHLAQLDGRLLNAIDDLPKDEMRNAGKWKSTITGGMVEAEHKYGDPFTFHAKAGHLMGCNVLPATSDTTRGFRRRVIVLQFTSIIEESEKNRQLQREIIEELPALVSYCMAALSNAIQRNTLTAPSSSEGLVENWLQTSAPIETFYEDYIRPLPDKERENPKLWTKAHAIYKRYADWAKETGHTGVYSETSFGEWLKGKLGVSHAEWTKAPFKRLDGGYYPIRFADEAQRAEEEARRQAEHEKLVEEMRTWN